MKTFKSKNVVLIAFKDGSFLEAIELLLMWIVLMIASTASGLLYDK